MKGNTILALVLSNYENSVSEIRVHGELGNWRSDLINAPQ